MRRRQTDWGVELVMFAQGGRGGVEGVEWGGYGMGEGSSGGSYSDSREYYVMRALGGRVGSASLAAFIVVAFDGSGGGGSIEKLGQGQTEERSEKSTINDTHNSANTAGSANTANTAT